MSAVPLTVERTNERQVTDPVTHLPVTIWDFHKIDMERIPPTFWQDSHESTGQSSKEQARESDKQHSKTALLVDQEVLQGFWRNAPAEENRARMGKAMVAGTAAAAGSIFSRVVGRYSNNSLVVSLLSAGLLSVSTFVLFIFFEPLWFKPRRPDANETFHPVKKSMANNAQDDEPESAKWLNSFLRSIWPIIDPGLFTSVGDLLEDSLTATLPKGINGVRVADIGQGSEPIRLLGIRWLKAGEAAIEKDGLAAEEGDFVNFEAAIAFRSDRTTEQAGLKSRQRNPHLLIQFFTVAGMCVPVWVEVSALLATIRMRIQLTPNPPFLSVATITFLGQPKVNMSCVPLVKHFVNIMDVPGLSEWIQDAIDSVMSFYVAPRSISLDLKAMLMARAKMDTNALGAFTITIKSSKGFRSGDEGRFWQSEGGKHGDAYVTVGWGKLGKDLWSSRVIQDEPEPKWEETLTLLLTETEINAQEQLRLQLWDSDRATADDLLGTINIPLEHLLTDESIQNKQTLRTDGFVGPNGSPCSGTLTWEIGYFAKTSFEQHLANKANMDAGLLKKTILEQAEKKLREAQPVGLASAGEIEQQKKEDLKEKTDEIIANTSPTEEWPSGILSITIEHISGLEIRGARRSGAGDKIEFEEDENDDLPSPYCIAIINHQVVYRTRTKLKTSRPFFAACTEKFIRDWRTTTVIICVKDSRLHETDPVLGVVHLSLADLFAENSQISDLYPLSGGIASGRIKASFTFRSVQSALPRNLLGWDVGTLDIESTAMSVGTLSSELASCKLVFRTSSCKGKMYSDPSQVGGWVQRHGKPIRLAVTERYSSCLLIQFRKRARIGNDSTEAFCTFWLKDIPDDESVELQLPVHSNRHSAIKKARMNASDEYGEIVGTLKIKFSFLPGLSGYHEKIARDDSKMHSVVESLDASQDTTAFDSQNDDDLDTESDASSSGSDDEILGEKAKSGPLSGIFKNKKVEQHRGLMQWRGARHLARFKRGAEERVKEVGDKVSGMAEHTGKVQTIEKEV